MIYFYDFMRNGTENQHFQNMSFIIDFNSKYEM